jgi:hypothetical protein
MTNSIPTMSLTTPVLSDGMAPRSGKAGGQREITGQPVADGIVTSMTSHLANDPIQPASSEAMLDATGYKGFYHHFLNMQTGRRAGRSELS